jgi:hypothetical protein
MHPPFQQPLVELVVMIEPNQLHEGVNRIDIHI